MDNNVYIYTHTHYNQKYLATLNNIYFHPKMFYS